MITINDTALNDNELIFVLRISLDDSTLRYATRGITLSTNVYSDTVLLRVDFTTLNSISKNIDIYNGGGVGSLSVIEFSLSNFSGAYIDEFYPSTTKPYLTSRKVEVGFLWSGATTEAEITWINSYYINSVNAETNKITCLCIELSDLEGKELPPYEVQKEFNNEMSYFPKAPKENFGQPIPILYGDFLSSIVIHAAFNGVYVPALLVEPFNFTGIICSHPVHTTSVSIMLSSQYVLLRYIQSVNYYQFLYKSDTSTVNNVRHTIKLIDAAVRPTTTSVFGYLPIRFGSQTLNSDVLDLSNVADQDETTYMELDGGEQIAMAMEGYVSSEIGYIPAGNANVEIVFRASSDSANNRTWTVKYKNESLAAPIDGATSSGTITTGTTVGGKTLQFNASSTAKKDGTPPWTPEEISPLDFIFMNTEVTSTDRIRIYRAYVQIFTVVSSRSDIKILRNNDGLRR